MRLDPWEPAVLAMCVWGIYIADRLLDVRRLPRGQWEPARKAFYRSNYVWAATTAGFLLVVAGWCSIFLLNARLVRAGIALALCVLLYFATVHLLPANWRTRWPRELAVGIFFSAGSFLAIAVAPGVRTGRLLAPAMILTLFGWANISLIEGHEIRRDALGKNALLHGSTRWIASKLVFTGLAAALCTDVLGALGMESKGFGFAASLSGVALSLIAFFRERIPTHLVPVAADLALCTPVLVLPFSLWVQSQ